MELTLVHVTYMFDTYKKLAIGSVGYGEAFKWQSVEAEAIVQLCLCYLCTFDDGRQLHAINFDSGESVVGPPSRCNDPSWI